MEDFMNKKTIIIAATILGVITLFSIPVVINNLINEDAEEPGVRTISATEVKQLLESNEEVVVIDVRSEDEHAEGNIPDSINIPIEFLNEMAEHIFQDPDLKIVVYCASGRRSSDAAQLLLEKGFTNIRDLGGLNNWPYETISGRG